MALIKSLTLGSLFDGSGGFPLAGALCGVTPVWASEIEPYPVAVTRSRFPGMHHLGSVTEIDGGRIPPVDIITFGSPCQDMSVAGKRAGMKHEGNGDDETTRSGLFYEAVRIIREMRIASHGVYPRIAVWENVPGAFTSNKGEDFRCVLEELAKICGGGYTIPRPAGGSWPNAGEIVGDGWSIAWRVLDAQYWGVLQRRRRIYLVADFAGERAGKILFKRESLRGHHAAGGSAREEAAGDVGGGAAGSDGVVYALNDKATRYQNGGLTRHNDGASNGMGVTDDGRMYTLDTACCHAVAFMAGQGAKARSIAAVEDGSPTLKASPSGLNQTPTVVYPIIARTLTAESDASPCVDRGQNIAVYPSVFHTLTAHNAHNIESAMTPNCVAIDCRNMKAIEELSGTLQAKGGGGYSLNYQNPVCYTQKEFGEYVCGVGTITTDSNPSKSSGCIVCMVHGKANAEIEDNLSPTPNCNHEQPITVYDTRQITLPENRSNPKEGDPCFTLNANAKGPLMVKSANKSLARKYIVRRLTPLECCRLQGFPDGWGEIEHKESMSEEEQAFWNGVRRTHAAVTVKPFRPMKEDRLLRWYNSLHTDSAEYKMWGNGIALPCAQYVMEGVAERLLKEGNT